MAERTITAQALVKELGDWAARRGSLACRLSDAIADALLHGRIAPGVRLPAERLLATVLDVSRTPVTAAYHRLAERGYAASRRGSGTTTQLPVDITAARRSWVGGLAGANGVIDLTATPRATPALLKLIGAAVASCEAGLIGASGYAGGGIAGLRQAIADRFTAGGLPTGPAEILVTAGTQQAIDVLVRYLLRAGSSAVAESPTYPGLLDILRIQRVRVHTLAVTEAGWDIEALDDAVTRTGSAVVFLTPDHHNPTGQTMPAEQRRAVVEVAARTGATLVVDETLRELWFARPGPPHVAADRRARVITVGSLSKSIWGGLRIGWVRADAATIARLAEIELAADLGGSALLQHVATELLDTADELFAQRRAELAAQRDVLAAALRTHCELNPRLPDGGLCLWIPVPEVSTTEL
ncbi:MAG TPA: PLP-dependent aminotransferase family protein, partial [Micromonosporaceae bacterium]|nr:PLP-dependent aminotransferase family protein [Micromonosporaceae bacterium]